MERFFGLNKYTTTPPPRLGKRKIHHSTSELSSLLPAIEFCGVAFFDANIFVLCEESSGVVADKVKYRRGRDMRILWSRTWRWIQVTV